MPATSGSMGRRRLLRLILLASLGLQLAHKASATDDQAAQILGNWLTEPRDGIIEISVASDGSYQGKIVGGNDPQRLDQHNPDPPPPPPPPGAPSMSPTAAEPTSAAWRGSTRTGCRCAASSVSRCWAARRCGRAIWAVR